MTNRRRIFILMLQSGGGGGNVERSTMSGCWACETAGSVSVAGCSRPWRKAPLARRRNLAGRGCGGFDVRIDGVSRRSRVAWPASAFGGGRRCPGPAAGGRAGRAPGVPAPCRAAAPGLSRTGVAPGRIDRSPPAGSPGWRARWHHRSTGERSGKASLVFPAAARVRPRLIRMRSSSGASLAAVLRAFSESGHRPWR